MTTLPPTETEFQFGEPSEGGWLDNHPAGTEITNEPNALEKAVRALANLNEESTDQDFLVALDIVDALNRIAKDKRDLWKQVALDRCMMRGDMLLGQRRFYAGYRNEKMVRDLKIAVGRVLELAGGDLDVLIGCLKSDSLKPSEVKLVVGDAFDELFETTRKDVLNEGEPTKKQLMEFNEGFVRKALDKQESA